MVENFFISSTSIDETQGSGRLVVEGQLVVPKECDDPIVELFRPIRAAQKDKMLFTVLVNRQVDSTSYTIYPSNHKDKAPDIFVKDALKCLKGDGGILSNYKALLELYFSEKTGLETYLKYLKQKEYDKCNESIKKFVADIGLTMPSLKPVEKPKKTKAQKRADGKNYQKAHPELKNTKKPAN